MLGRLLCSLGLHRVITTHEGKPAASAKRNTVSGAASTIHGFCHRADCKFRFILDTHSGDKVLLVRGDGTEVRSKV